MHIALKTWLHAWSKGAIVPQILNQSANIVLTA